MTPFAPFVKAMAANPQDTEPGLAFADWLEDKGFMRLPPLLRHPDDPGSPTAHIGMDAWNPGAWRNLQLAMSELGKKNLAVTINDMVDRGQRLLHRDYGNTPREDAPWICDTDLSHTGNGICFVNKIPHWPAVHFRIAGVPIIMEALRAGTSPAVTRQRWQQANGIDYFNVHFLDHRRYDNREAFGMRRYGITIVPHQRGIGLLHEADAFKEPRDLVNARNIANDHGLHAEEPEQFSMADRVRKAIRLAREYS